MPPVAPRTKARTLDAIERLPAVIRRLLTVQDPDDLLPEILKVCKTLLICEEVSFHILSPDGKELIDHTVVGGKLRPTQVRVRVGIEGVTGWVAGRKKIALVTDVRKDSRYVQADPKRRSEAAIPIMSGDRLMGVLNFESNQVGFFKPADLPVLEFLAAQLAIALRVLEIRRSEEGLRDRVAMIHHLSRLSGGFLATDQYLARIVEVSRRTIGCYYAAIFQGDYDREHVVLLAQSSAEPINITIGATQRFRTGIIGSAFELGEIVYVRDVTKDSKYIARLKGVKSEVSIPIRVGDHCLGILDAQADRIDGFTSDDLMVLETVARTLVPTIQSLKVPTA